MPNGIKLDLQEALARGPSGIPNLEPLFAPGAIPPIFDDAPEVEEGPGFIPGGGIPGVTTGTFTGEPIDIDGGSIGQPVPPVKQSRGDRLRALLGNFLQNFGTGLQAASRAPSGADFAAGIGAALSAPAERRRQQVFADLLRANQAFRQREIELREARLEQDAAQFQQSFEFTEAQAKRPRTFEAFAVNLLQAGDEAGARRIIELSRGNPQRRLVTRQAGQDLVGLDPTTLSEITRIPDFFPPPKVKPQKAQALTEGERGRLSVELLRQFGVTQPETRVPGLIAEGEFVFRLKRNRVATIIDGLTRKGMGIDGILRTFVLAAEEVEKRGDEPSLDNVLKFLSKGLRR